MHRMQSGGWPYSEDGRDSSKAPSLRVAFLRTAVCKPVSMVTRVNEDVMVWLSRGQRYNSRETSLVASLQTTSKPPPSHANNPISTVLSDSAGPSDQVDTRSKQILGTVCITTSKQQMAPPQILTIRRLWERVMECTVLNQP